MGPRPVLTGPDGFGRVLTGPQQQLSPETLSFQLEQVDIFTPNKLTRLRFFQPCWNQSPSGNFLLWSWGCRPEDAAQVTYADSQASRSARSPIHPANVHALPSSSHSQSRQTADFSPFAAVVGSLAGCSHVFQISCTFVLNENSPQTKSRCFLLWS